MRSCGFKISVDDYGTGYSSLSYLKKMPVNEVKIDRAFITNIMDDESSQTIVEATVKMCHELGFKVVVEGVENIETVELLYKMSCDLFQGYVFSKPMPLESFAEFKKRFYSERKMFV